MTGVEILATEEVATATTFNWSSFGWVILMAACIFIVFGIFVSVAEGDFSYLAILFASSIVFGLLMGTVVGFGDGVPTEYETQYKVTISDEVQMNDFLDHYEIVSQEGKIYTVRERNGD